MPQISQNSKKVEGFFNFNLKPQNGEELLGKEPQITKSSL